MRCRALLGCLAFALMLSVGAGRAAAQAMLADDIVILSKGQREQEKARTTTTHLGGIPGVGGSPFRANPGGGEARLGEPPGGAVSSASMRQRDVLSAASRRRPGPRRRPVPPGSRRPATQSGPEGADLRAAGGAGAGPTTARPMASPSTWRLHRLSQVNYGLRTKFQEIPKAQADILSAGLRANPLVFASADGVPYGSYSPQRPGDNSYSVVLIQPIDVNQKRKVRVVVAQQAKKVLDAQYQDAVRLEIDNLYTAFVDVLDAREGGPLRKGQPGRAEPRAGDHRAAIRQAARAADRGGECRHPAGHRRGVARAGRDGSQAGKAGPGGPPRHPARRSGRPGDTRLDPGRGGPAARRPTIWAASPCASGPMSSPTGWASAVPRRM